MSPQVSVWKYFTRTVSRSVMGSVTAQKRRKTAGLIIIGDEILRGDVVDTNSNFACKVLHNLGIKMKKITVVADNIEEVSAEVALFSTLFDYVITSGGIGPTHDDITFEGVAKAFGETLVFNSTIQGICEKYCHKSSKLKLSQIPESAQLKFYPELKFPGIRVKNVFLFPGIPQFFESSFSVIAKDSFQCHDPFYSKVIYLNLTEEEILNDLNYLVELCPQVVFGSYPILNDSCYQLKITMESEDVAATNEAYSKLLELVPEQVIIKR